MKRLVTIPVGLAVMVGGRVLDALLGPDELAGLTWPSTTPEE